MNLDAEWAMAVLQVIQATNVVLVHTPGAFDCCSVRDLDIRSLQSQLALTEQSLVEVANLMNKADGDSRKLCNDVGQFIWSVLHMHNASFCPHCGCELCLPNIVETKWATCLAIVRTHSDIPDCLATILDHGPCWAFIHSRDVPIILDEDSRACASQQSHITSHLLLTTLGRESRADLDTLHELILLRSTKLPV